MPCQQWTNHGLKTRGMIHIPKAAVMLRIWMSRTDTFMFLLWQSPVSECNVWYAKNVAVHSTQVVKFDCRSSCEANKTTKISRFWYENNQTFEMFWNKKPSTELYITYTILFFLKRRQVSSFWFVWEWKIDMTVQNCLVRKV